jgi:hypothetical protein
LSQFATETAKNELIRAGSVPDLRQTLPKYESVPSSGSIDFS